MKDFVTCYKFLQHSTFHCWIVDFWFTFILFSIKIYIYIHSLFSKLKITAFSIFHLLFSPGNRHQPHLGISIPTSIMSQLILWLPATLIGCMSQLVGLLGSTAFPFPLHLHTFVLAFAVPPLLKSADYYLPSAARLLWLIRHLP